MSGMIANPRTPREQAKWFKQFGHHWNPAKEFASLRSIDDGNISKMTGSEKDFALLARSWQLSDANINNAVELVHRRQLRPDGDIGPASQAVLEMKRCAMPDFAPPPTASFNYDDPGLQAAVESYQRFAAAKTGSGSWPVGCDPQRKDVHSVVVGIDTSNASTFQKSIMADVLRYVEETEAEIGQAVRHVLTGASKPQHSVKFEFISGGVIGYAYFPEPDECNQTVTARIDNSFDARLAVLAELLTHEYKGHSDGLEHTNGGIMNASIGSPTVRASWKGDKHESTKRRYFGGEPLTPTVPELPPSHPPTSGSLFAEQLSAGKIAIRGIVTFDKKWAYIAEPDGAGAYRLAPKQQV